MKKKILTLVVINFSQNVCWFIFFFIPVKFWSAPFASPILLANTSHVFEHLWNRCFFTSFPSFCLFTYLALKRNYESNWWEGGRKKTTHTRKSYTRIVICLSTVRIIGVFFFLVHNFFFSPEIVSVASCFAGNLKKLSALIFPRAKLF